MSGLGHQRTFALQRPMSALPPKADMCSALTHVCFGPKRTHAPQQIALKKKTANCGGLTVWQQRNLAQHSAFAQHLVRAARLFERQPLRDQGLDLALFEQVQQR
jgi:hypothetical protein